MKLRQLFAAGLIAVGLMSISISPAAAQTVTKLRVQSTFPASSLIFEGSKFWAERVKP